MKKRDKITVLGPDDPNKERLGWKIYTIPTDMTAREYWKQELSKEDFEKWEYENDPERNRETDMADKYLRGQKFEDKKSWF